MAGRNDKTILRMAAAAAAALITLFIGFAGPASASPHAGWGKVYATGGTVVAGGLSGSAIGTREYGNNDGEIAGGTDPIQRSSALSYAEDFLVFHNIAGHAAGSSSVAVDPSAGRLTAHNHAHKSGCGPQEYIVNLLGQELHLPWGNYFGESYAYGYFSTIFFVAPGSSGLAKGDPVELILRTRLDGLFSSSPNGSYGHVYAGTRLADITAVPEFPSWAQQGWSAWTDIEGMLHGSGSYIGHGILKKHLDYEHAEDFEHPAEAYDSGEIVIDARVGEWLFLEGYFQVDVKLPAHGGVWEGHTGDAGFQNSMNVSLTAGLNSPGIAVEARDFPRKLTLRIDGSGTVTRTPDAELYPAGTPVVLAAVPETGWGFDGWSGDAAGEANPLTVTLDSDMTLTARFVKFGDVNGSGEVNLADAVSVLQALSGISAPGFHRGGDVNGDSRIGLAEALFILQTVSNLR